MEVVVFVLILAFASVSYLMFYFRDQARRYKSTISTCVREVKESQADRHKWINDYGYISKKANLSAKKLLDIQVILDRLDSETEEEG